MLEVTAPPKRPLLRTSTRHVKRGPRAIRGEYSVRFTPDELTVYFARGADSVTAPFGDLRRVEELSADSSVTIAHGDSPSWLSPDNCRLYISSTRTGTFQIYLATRRPGP